MLILDRVKGWLLWPNSNKPAQSNSRSFPVEEHVDPLLADANGLMEQEEYARALPLYEDLVRQNLHLRVAYTRSMLCLYKLGRHEDVQRLFEQVVRLFPDHEPPYQYYGLSLMAQHHWREATEHWLEYIRRFSAKHPGYANGLHSAISAGDYDAVERIYRAARHNFLADESVSDESKAHFCMLYLNSLLEQKRWDEASTVLRTVSALSGATQQTIDLAKKFLDSLPDKQQRLRENQELILAGAYRTDQHEAGPTSPTEEPPVTYVEEVLAGQLRTASLEDIYPKIVFTHDAEEDLVPEPPQHGSHYYIFRSGGRGDRPPINIYAFDNCYLTVDLTISHRYQFYLFDSDGRYIPSLSTGDTPSFGDIRDIHEDVALCEDKFVSARLNICHLLLDKVGRANYFKTIPVDSFLFLNASQYLQDLSDILDIRLTDISCFERSRVVTLRISRLYVADSTTFNLRHPGQNLSRVCIEQLTRLKNRIGTPTDRIHPRKRIYIDRKNAETRRVLNSEDVNLLLKKAGFDLVQAEKYSLVDQARLFNQAEVVFAVHGAGLTNITFCEPGTKVIELMPALCASAAYWKLARALSLDYDAVILEDPELPQPDYTKWTHDAQRYNSRDVLVPLDKLSQMLDSLPQPKTAR